MDPVLDLVLNASQTKWLLNLENLLVEHDVLNEQNEEHATRKKAWLNTWKTNAHKAYVDTFNNVDDSSTVGLASFFCSVTQLLQDGDELFAADSKNTWYYIVILEAHLFQPYTPLSESDPKKRWKGLTWGNKDYLRTIVELQGK